MTDREIRAALATAAGREWSRIEGGRCTCEFYTNPKHYTGLIPADLVREALQAAGVDPSKWILSGVLVDSGKAMTSAELIAWVGLPAVGARRSATDAARCLQAHGYEVDQGADDLWRITHDPTDPS